MAGVDYAALKKGGFMRQKQKGFFSLRIQVVGGNLTAENIKTVAEVAEKGSLKIQNAVIRPEGAEASFFAHTP